MADAHGGYPPTSPLAPLAAYPVRRPSRAPEFYGFVALTGTSLLFALYHLWALIPDGLIQRAGVDWYPSREWAVLVPSYSIVLILLTYFSYWALAISSTPAFNDLRTITDSFAHVPLPDEPNPYLRQANPDAIPEMFDIPIGLVNQVLFQYRDEDRELNTQIIGGMTSLTGPGMAGKSTMMRMTAAGVIMAQLGMLVPAASARLSPVDSILTRMGAYDNMFSNAVLHHLATHTLNLSCFTTRYSSLTDDFTYHPNIRNMHMQTMVDDENRELLLLYKLMDGVAT